MDLLELVKDVTNSHAFHDVQMVVHNSAAFTDLPVLDEVVRTCATVLYNDVVPFAVGSEPAELRPLIEKFKTVLKAYV